MQKDLSPKSGCARALVLVGSAIALCVIGTFVPNGEVILGVLLLGPLGSVFTCKLDLRAMVKVEG